jgi:DNA replication and repair protein RecF
MGLSELSVQHFRCVEAAELELHPQHNLRWGNNAAGKTSVLEAAYLLGRGRSFRTRISERLIQHGAQQLVAFGRTNDLVPQSIGVQIGRRTEAIAKLNGQLLPSLADLSRAFPVQVIEPGVHRLLEEGGQRRRRWLDWGVFHVEPRFMESWSMYTRGLRQRNAALKGQPEAAAIWDVELARHGENVATARGRFMDALLPHWAQTAARLMNLEIELHYNRGWPQGLSLLEAFAAASDRDRQRGITHSGPHRADVAIKVRGRAAKEVLSRGQQKMAAVGLVLSQLRLLRATNQVVATLLLDDPAAELDKERLERFREQVLDLGCQLLVTALGTSSTPLGQPDRAFHVEQGTVQLV